MKKIFFTFKDFIDGLIRRSNVRYFIVFVVFSILSLFCYFFSLSLFQNERSLEYFFPREMGFVVVLSQLLFVYAFKLNKGIWKYSSISDLVTIIKVASISFVFNSMVSAFVVDFSPFTRVLVVNHMIFILSYGGVRLAVRLYKNVETISTEIKKILIVGAGDGGDVACRRLKRVNGQYKVVGFLDDDPQKKKCEIHGVKVLGVVGDIKEMIAAYNVDEVVIAIPSARSLFVKTIAEQCFEEKVAVKIMSKISNFSGEEPDFEMRNLKLEDLLAREPIKMDLSPVKDTYSGKRVLITGAAGSIGEELVKQVARLGASDIYLLDQAESPLYMLYREQETRFSHVHFIPLLCDITDSIALSRAFAEARPHIVLHAAAYKHVPLLEENIYQAMMVNVEGTRRLAELAMGHQVERFIFISTDKAVNPTNILGVSKRISELLCQSLQEKAQTKFIVVRFGNVIGSQGSVIPLFKKQIESGGPITVTHKEIQRYFMMIPEAVQLVLFSSVLGKGGEIFVLDMGKQVRIADLAKNMIQLCGYQPGKDMQIEYVGLRPGEKLYEELYDSTERVSSTEYEKINKALGKVWKKKDLMLKIDACLEAACRDTDRVKLVSMFKELVPTYQDMVVEEKAVVLDFKKAV